MNLSEEQRKRIELNRIKAQERRKNKQGVPQDEHVNHYAKRSIFQELPERSNHQNIDSSHVSGSGNQYKMTNPINQPIMVSSDLKAMTNQKIEENRRRAVELRTLMNDMSGPNSESITYQTHSLHLKPSEPNMQIMHEEVTYKPNPSNLMNQQSIISSDKTVIVNRKIEENRKRALELKNKKSQNVNSIQSDLCATNDYTNTMLSSNSKLHNPSQSETNCNSISSSVYNPYESSYSKYQSSIILNEKDIIINQKIEENRKRALELKNKKNQNSNSIQSDSISSSSNNQSNLVLNEKDIIIQKMEENRKRALELKNKKNNNANSIQSDSIISSSSVYNQHESVYSTNQSNSVSNEKDVINKKIEENRKRALELKNKRMEEQRKQDADKSNSCPSNTLSNLLPHNLLSQEELDNINRPVSSSNYNGVVHYVNCSIKSPQRFNINAKYHGQLIQLIKTMPTREYDSATCRWSLHFDDYERFLKSVKSLEPQVKVEALPKFVISSLKSTVSRDKQSLCENNPLRKKLLPFQKEGVEFALSLRGRALIADDMGLGKTIQAICVMLEYREEWPLLIICPSSLRLTWGEALTTWIEDLCDTDINILLKGSDVLGNEQVTVINYDLLTKFELLNRFKCVIADESHFIKNSKTVRCKATISILQNTRRCLLLTGTPALSRPIELYTQLLCVNKRKMPPVQEFGVRYCAGTKGTWGWDFTGNSNLEELNVFMCANFMIRRLKKDVLEQLPTKRRKKVIIEAKMSSRLSIAEKVASNATKKDYQACLFEYYAETAGAKLPGVIRYITELVESEKKFLLFAHHQTMVGGVASHLQSNNIKFILIDGKTPADVRQELVNKFQTDSRYLVAVLSITAANSGFTLTAADTVVFAELFYNPGILQQAEDRVHRIGQRNAVVVHYLVARKTADDTFWPMIESKLSVLGDMGMGNGDFKDVQNSSFRTDTAVGSGDPGIMSFFKPVAKYAEEEGGEPASKKSKLG